MRQLLFLGLCFVSLATYVPAQGTPGGGGSPSLPSAQGDFRPILFGDSAPYEYTRPFFPDASFDPAVTPPERLLGQPLGSRLAHHAEVVAAYRQWAQESARVDLASYGRTHEGRELLRVVIGSPGNVRRLDEISRALRSLADPRGLDDARAQSILDDMPAIAWLGYSIHGDETSGTDASLAVAYRLIAGTDAEVEQLLERVVVVIDPCLNPDGRMRTVTQVEQNAGYVTNLDLHSRHRGHWPHGRGNHYLFDMNRDWLAGVCPETRGRWKVARELPAQLFVDAHEMDGFDTYLFYPQAAPHNPQRPPKLSAWQTRFALDQSRAFDRFGWAYYTREWADAWYPGYTDSWGALNGGIGLLYEQASVSGQPLRRPSGRVVSYREAVHGHVVSSLTNLATLAANRREILSDYLDFHRSAVDPERSGSERAFAFVPGRCPDREAALVDLLVAQGIEVRVAGEPFVARELESTLGLRTAERTLPAGTYLVSARQPRAALLRSYLDFDPRMDEKSLVRERESLEREGESKVYDVTAWDLGRSFDLDGYWCEPLVEWDGGACPVVAQGARAASGVAGSAGQPAYAYVVDGRSDASVKFAARAMELGLAVHLADEAFTSAGQSFVRGSLLLRRHENGADFDARVERAAGEAGVLAVASASGRSTDEGPDLGGGHFHLLERPRVAVVAGAPVESEGYGHIWHLLDVQFGLPFSILEAHELGSYDLRRYNVLILPPGRLQRVLDDAADKLSVWVRSGGVLIACGSSAAAVAGGAGELSSVVLRRNALDQLDAHAFAAELQADAREVRIDLEQLWGETPPDPEASGKSGKPGDSASPESGSGDETAALERRDTWARRFAPAGALLRTHVDERHWITAGAGPELPVGFGGEHVLLSPQGVRTPVRFAESSRLRLGGLLWPEASERIQQSAWLTVERCDNGALILFASAPAFRGVLRATARLLGNGIVFGPGLAANPPGEW